MINPKCAICGESPSFKKFKHLFLELDKLSPKIKKWVEKADWNVGTKNLALSWLKRGLKPRSITRDLEWGVKVPLKGWEDKVFYVWFDAPIGYISGTKELRKDWTSFWKKKDSKIVHFLGKDNIPFHTVWWGGMLLANGEFTLPYKVAGLQFLNYEGKKISKSNKWGIFCEKLAETGIPSDVWRFYLSFLLPEGKDTDWKWDEFVEKTNKELLGNYGNLINRIITFIDKRGGKLKKGSPSKKDLELIESSVKTSEEIKKLVDEIKLREALKKILLLSDKANQYFQHNKPWEGGKNVETVLWVCSNLIKNITIMLSPFIPESCQKVANAFSFEIEWEQINKKLGGKKIKAIDLLFPKIKREELNKIKKIVTNPTPLEKIFGEK